MTAIRSVLMFCPQFRPIVGGAERQAEKLSKALVRCGLRVRVLTPRLAEGTPAYEEDSGVEIHRFPLFDLSKKLPVHGIGPLNLLSIRAQTMRAVSRHIGDLQIVHAHIASSLVAFAMQAAQGHGVPVLCKAATGGLKSDLGELAAIGSGGPSLVRVMIQRLDCWVATTQAVRDSLLDGGVSPEKIATIPNGVELPPVRNPRRPEPARRFLYLGRLSTNTQRDVPALVRAFDRIADELPDAELAIAGDGDLYGETAALAAKARNKARIQMPGTQPPAPWLDWAHCFVLPSRYEGLSNALLEAMACGLPCIANDIPPNREVLDAGHAGILVPVGDEEQMTSAMLRVATDENLASELGNTAFQRVREFYGIEAVAGRYMQLYELLLSSSKEKSHGTRRRTRGR